MLPRSWLQMLGAASGQAPAVDFSPSRTGTVTANEQPQPHWKIKTVEVGGPEAPPSASGWLSYWRTNFTSDVPHIGQAGAAGGSNDIRYTA